MIIKLRARKSRNLARQNLKFINPKRKKSGSKLQREKNRFFAFLPVKMTIKTFILNFAKRICIE
jgi:hypothetical protein